MIDRRDSVIITACIDGDDAPQLNDRLELVQQLITAISSNREAPFLLVLPGGFLSSNKADPTSLCRKAVRAITTYLDRTAQESTIIFGVDGGGGADQLGLAVSRQGLIAKARKFFPTGAEVYKLARANSPWAAEEGVGRLVRFGGHAFYMAVCYDSFGIKKERVPRLEAEAVINLVHGFSRPPASGSGSFYFARDGMVGAARTWDCPVFAAAHFAGGVHENWPTGVAWDQGDRPPSTWRYAHNPLRPQERVAYRYGSERIALSIFRLSEVFGS